MRSVEEEPLDDVQEEVEMGLGDFCRHEDAVSDDNAEERLEVLVLRHLLAQRGAERRNLQDGAREQCDEQLDAASDGRGPVHRRWHEVEKHCSCYTMDWWRGCVKMRPDGLLWSL